MLRMVVSVLVSVLVFVLRLLWVLVTGLVMALLAFVLWVLFVVVGTPLAWAWDFSRMLGCLTRIIITGGRPQTLPLAGARGWCWVLKALLARGHSVNATDLSGQTALMLAAANNHIAAVKTLLACPSCNVCASAFRNGPYSGQTALINAATGGHVEIVELLLAAGANVKSTDSDGESALHWAARGPHDKVCAALLAAGSDPDLRCRTEGNTPLFVAILAGQKLAAAPANSKKALQASWHRTVAVLLAAGASWNPFGSGAGGGASGELCESSLLFYAVKSEDEELVALMMASGQTCSKLDYELVLYQALHGGGDTVNLVETLTHPWINNTSIPRPVRDLATRFARGMAKERCLQLASDDADEDEAEEPDEDPEDSHGAGAGARSAKGIPCACCGVVISSKRRHLGPVDEEKLQSQHALAAETVARLQEEAGRKLRAAERLLEGYRAEFAGRLTRGPAARKHARAGAAAAEGAGQGAAATVMRRLRATLRPVLLALGSCVATGVEEVWERLLLPTRRQVAKLLALLGRAGAAVGVRALAVAGLARHRQANRQGQGAKGTGRGAQKARKGGQEVKGARQKGSGGAGDRFQSDKPQQDRLQQDKPQRGLERGVQQDLQQGESQGQQQQQQQVQRATKQAAPPATQRAAEQQAAAGGAKAKQQQEQQQQHGLQQRAAQQQQGQAQQKKGLGAAMAVAGSGGQSQQEREKLRTKKSAGAAAAVDGSGEQNQTQQEKLQTKKSAGAVVAGVGSSACASPDGSVCGITSNSSATAATTATSATAATAATATAVKAAPPAQYAAAGGTTGKPHPSKATTGKKEKRSAVQQGTSVPPALQLDVSPLPQQTPLQEADSATQAGRGGAAQDSTRGSVPAPPLPLPVPIPVLPQVAVDAPSAPLPAPSLHSQPSAAAAAVAATASLPSAPTSSFASLHPQQQQQQPSWNQPPPSTLPTLSTLPGPLVRPPIHQVQPEWLPQPQPLVLGQTLGHIPNLNLNLNPADQAAAAGVDAACCVVCMERRRERVLLPCRHLVLCGACCDAIQARSNECPVCRQAIAHAVHVLQ